MPPAFCFSSAWQPMETCLSDGFELSKRNGLARIVARKNAAIGRPPRNRAGHISRSVQVVPLDLGSVAGFASVCRDASSSDPDLYGGPSSLECAGYLPFCGRVRGYGTSFARNDSGLRGPGSVRPVQDSVHRRTSRYLGGVRLVVALQYSGDPAGGDGVGNLAWNDADLRLLPNL